MRIIFTLLITIALLISCKQQEPTLNGNWISVGSGEMLQITDSTQYAFYDYTEISCLPARQGPLSELMASLKLTQDTLDMKIGVVTYKFTRAKKLQELCLEEVDLRRAQSALYNFEVFAQTVKENYAFLDAARLDWDTLYKMQRDKILFDPTDSTLYKTIEETSELLNDNHGFLEASAEFYETYVPDYESQFEPDEDPLPEYGDFQVAARVTNTFLTEDLTKDSPIMSWGKLNDSLGFIQIKAMWLYADLNIPQQLVDELGYVDAYVNTFHKIFEADYIEMERAAVAQIMDLVMEDLKDTKALIIDVRFNGGGQDAVSFEILSRFTDKKLQVAKQKLRHGDGYSPVLPLYINGSKAAYLKPVYVLTSPQTGSAAEAFAIATMAMDNVKRIGLPTQGAMSTALEKTLPNGWHFALSNEVYMDIDGKCYENLGVPPDVLIDYPKDRQAFFRSVIGDLAADKTTILNEINRLKN